MEAEASSGALTGVRKESIGQENINVGGRPRERAMIDYHQWGIYTQFQTEPIQSTLGCLFVLAMICFCIWLIYDAVFVKWKCVKCGTVFRGHNQDLGRYSDVGPCCIWRRLSQDEYNRSFGIPNEIRRVK